MAISPFIGTRTTSDWPADSVPGNYREVLLRLYPNGSAPLTAMMAMMDTEMTDNFTFHWAMKRLPEFGGTITGVYTDQVLGSAYASGAVKGTNLYLKCAELTAKQVVPNTVVSLGEEAEHRSWKNATVVATHLNGANSYIQVRMDEAANATYDLDVADRIDTIGSAHEQGATITQAVSFDETWDYNYTQIWRAALSITRTARKTRLRTHDAYVEAKREALELLAIQMDMSAIFGKKDITTGILGNPITKTDGFITKLTTLFPENVFDYKNDTDYSGYTWVQAGQDFLEKKLIRTIGRFGTGEKLCLCGDYFPYALKDLVEAGAEIQISPGRVVYGVTVDTWNINGVNFHVKVHPRWSQIARFRKLGVVLEPQFMRFRPIDDVFFKEDDAETTAHNNSRDGTEEEWVCEGGYEFHHLETGAVIYNFGDDNAL